MSPKPQNKAVNQKAVLENKQTITTTKILRDTVKTMKQRSQNILLENMTDKEHDCQAVV